MTSLSYIYVSYSYLTLFYSVNVLAKVPFPLTMRFKAMLQRGIELTTLDASW